MAIHRPAPGQIIEHLYFDREQVASVQDDGLSIVKFEDIGVKGMSPDIVIPMYDSFLELLAFWGYESFSLGEDKKYIELHIEDVDINRPLCLRILERRLGFNLALPATKNCWIASDNSIDIRIHRWPDSPSKSFFVDISGLDSKKVRRIDEVLRANLPVIYL